ncbi:hypothetical protein J4H86_25000 [Spiractinospora alimapuensis]|uniref:hypothetical protein n=1 Tax=Spiractinospora alimapuensis TaxID=2820884 RepID=UPI001F1DB5C2|nr:hypothetical protein [Spiractinospora alimapuensis]QVQ51960.1 hypothetical protein J4H86_25000 [Spiractinospora alimapuensis]
MSLTDPLESPRQNATELRGSPRALTATLIWGLGGCAAAGLLGLGIGGIVDQVRIVLLNSVFSSWDAGVPVALRAAAIPLGILGSILCFGQYAKWNHRFTRRATHFAFIGPASLVLIGLAVGTWAATTMWAEPDTVGIAVDPTFHNDEAWGVGAWVMYSAQWWLPGLFVLLGGLSLIGRLASNRHRTRNATLAAELLRSGILVDAEVVQSPAVSLDSARTAASVIVRFSDPAGASRWVRCSLFLPPREVPLQGEYRPLVFDPSDPGNRRRILLSPTGSLEPVDFLPTRAA